MHVDGRSSYADDLRAYRALRGWRQIAGETPAPCREQSPPEWRQWRRAGVGVHRGAVRPERDGS